MDFQGPQEFHRAAAGFAEGLAEVILLGFGEFLGAQAGPAADERGEKSRYGQSIHWVGDGGEAACAFCLSKASIRLAARSRAM